MAVVTQRKVFSFTHFTTLKFTRIVEASNFTSHLNFLSIYEASCEIPLQTLLTTEDFKQNILKIKISVSCFTSLNLNE